MNEKDTNPKDAVSIRKVPLHVVPCRVEMELGLAMLEGARKYGSHNYRVAGVRASVYYDAAMRHLKAFWEGQDTDPDSGLHHLIKAMACEAVLRDGQHMGNWIDDRPPRLPDGLDLEQLNKQASEIIDRYPDAKESYTQTGEIVVDDHPDIRVFAYQGDPACWKSNCLDCARYGGSLLEPCVDVPHGVQYPECFKSKDGA